MYPYKKLAIKLIFSMKPKDLHNPHDAMFKKVFGRRETAEEFMKNFLPAALHQRPAHAAQTPYRGLD